MINLSAMTCVFCSCYMLIFLSVFSTLSTTTTHLDFVVLLSLLISSNRLDGMMILRHTLTHSHTDTLVHTHLYTHTHSQPRLGCLA